jgi:hypothetical protein
LKWSVGRATERAPANVRGQRVGERLAGGHLKWSVG